MVYSPLWVSDCHSSQLNSKSFRLLDHIFFIVLFKFLQIQSVSFTLGQKEFTSQLLLYFLILLKDHNYFLKDFLCLRKLLSFKQFLHFEKFGRTSGYLRNKPGFQLKFVHQEAKISIKLRHNFLLFTSDNEKAEQKLSDKIHYIRAAFFHNYSFDKLFHHKQRRNIDIFFLDGYFLDL